MKPQNERPDLLLEDGAPVQCKFAARADAPVFWEDCEQNATGKLSGAEIYAFRLWREQHPKAIIIVWAKENAYLCDAHLRTVKEAIGE